MVTEDGKTGGNYLSGDEQRMLSNENIHYLSGPTDVSSSALTRGQRVGACFALSKLLTTSGYKQNKRSQPRVVN